MKDETVLTDEQRQKYLQNPNNCPFCGELDVEAERPRVGDYDECVYCRVTCLHCIKSWYDQYSLSGIMTESEYEG